MKTWTLPTLLSILALASGCSSTSASSEPSPSPDDDVSMATSTLKRDTSPRLVPGDPEALRDGNTLFATDLYGTLRNDPSFANRNLFFSPYSISVALAMTYAGARGATADEIAKTMHFTLPSDRLHTAFNMLDLSLSSHPTLDSQSPLTLRVADSMWGAPQTTFGQPFLDTLAVDYGAGVRLTDFEKDPEGARGRINAWVASETADKILDLIPAGNITNDTRFVLVNAVYFNAGWSAKFTKGATAPGTFHGIAGDTSIPMMSQEADLAYGEGDGWRGIDLPYDGGLSFTAIVPDNLANFESSMTPAILKSVDSAFARADVMLKLPKFTIRGTTFSLKNALQTQGITTLFGGSADLSGISTSESLQVADVLHQAFIGLDEDGTEAAAATAVIGNGISDSTPVMPTKKVELTLDKPFVFFIRDTQTGAILFEGRYVGG